MPSVLAPSLAAFAASVTVVALRLPRRPVMASLAPRGDRRRPALAERLGSSALIKRATDADRIRPLLDRVGRGDGTERFVGTAALVSAGITVVCLRIGGAALLVAPLLAIAALRAPALLAAGTARQRLRAIERDVPLLLDVLSLASFAGLPPQSALRRAVAAIDGPLADELSAALADIELGARWRDRLARFAEDLPIPDLRRAVALLLRADAIGSSTTGSIAILADDVRAARRAAAGERARKAPVQMLFPLVFLVLPAFLLLTVVPVLVATLGSIR